MASGFASVTEVQISSISSADYLSCVVYTKTIIHLSVRESGGYSTTIHLHFGE